VAIKTHDYDRKFIKSLRVYLRINFTDVVTSYRYKNISDNSKYRGIVMTAKSESCTLRFETWGGNPLAEVTFVFTTGDNYSSRKIFSSYIEIGTGVSGNMLEEDLKFINKVLSKASMSGNNALDFFMGME